tara:strand:+ start:444 stop:764 length:321 start_codon:yes stop_codon:yes gene_type:complete
MKYPNSNNPQSWSDLVAASHREIPPEIDVSHEVYAALIQEERESNAVDWTEAILALFKMRSIQIASATCIACIILLTVISFMMPSADTDEDPVISFITNGDWSVFL